MHDFDEVYDILEGGFTQQSVVKIKDVPSPLSRGDAFAGRLGDIVQRPSGQEPIAQVPLDDAVPAKKPTRISNGDMTGKAENVRSRFAEQFNIVKFPCERDGWHLPA